MINFPSLFLPILEEMKNEKIYLGNDGEEVKNSPPFEQKAISALNEAFQQANQMTNPSVDFSAAASLLEKIQVATAECERAAFVTKTYRARKSFQIVRKIAHLGREILHELKYDRIKQKAA